MWAFWWLRLCAWKHFKPNLYSDVLYCTFWRTDSSISERRGNRIFYAGFNRISQNLLRILSASITTWCSTLVLRAMSWGVIAIAQTTTEQKRTLFGLSAESSAICPPVQTRRAPSREVEVVASSLGVLRLDSTRWAVAVALNSRTHSSHFTLSRRGPPLVVLFLLSFFLLLFILFFSISTHPLCVFCSASFFWRVFCVLQCVREERSLIKFLSLHCLRYCRAPSRCSCRRLSTCRRWCCRLRTRCATRRLATHAARGHFATTRFSRALHEHRFALQSDALLLDVFPFADFFYNFNILKWFAVWFAELSIFAFWSNLLFEFW